jgi:uncharacterized cofD-like protein
VALGGGHGLAAALQAIRRYAADITAVVSVADDGGSSGRLRRAFDVPAPGDLRKCLVALSEDPVWARAFEHRFASGDVQGHALGNLLIVGLAESLGDFGSALEEAGRVLRSVGRVLPATVDAVAIKADLEDRVVEGQVAVMNAPGRIRRVSVVPTDAPAHPDAVVALRRADQIVLAPGSLYTSLLPVVCVPEIAAALAAAKGRIVQVLNLREQDPETSGLDGTDHLRATLDHGARVDVLVHHDGPVDEGWLSIDAHVARDLGVDAVAAPVVRSDGLAHEPARLASVLARLA